MLVDLVIEKHQKAPLAPPVFSILIPSWNNLAYLKLCVVSIRRNSRYKHQIIVHVNEGSDGTLDWVKAQPDLDYTYSSGNIGVCYALNLARELVATEYIVYMNDDMYACPDWDGILMTEVKRIGHKFFFLSATAIEPVDTKNPCVIVQDFGNHPENFYEEALLSEYTKFNLDDWQGSTWPPNIVHRDIWDLVGGYSTEFSPGMYSDPDFSMKCWQAGIRLFKGIGRSKVYHFGSRSTGRIKKNRGYYRFIEKWGMSSSTLTKYYLRRGQSFDGPLKEPRLGIGLRLKNLLKRLQTAFMHS